MPCASYRRKKGKGKRKQSRLLQLAQHGVGIHRQNQFAMLRWNSLQSLFKFLSFLCQISVVEGNIFFGVIYRWCCSVELLISETVAAVQYVIGENLSVYFSN